MEMVTVADVDRRKKEKDPNPTPENDNPALDQTGDQREWNNWVIDTFTPSNMIPADEAQRGERAVGAGKVSYIKGLQRGNSFQIGNQTSTFMGKSDRFERILQQYQSSGQKFVDQEFPATIQSLAGFDETGTAKREYGNLIWERPEVYFDGKRFGVFDNDIDPGDIEQGGLGDCYLLGALSSIAEDPERIMRLIYSKNVNGSGVYCVGLCITGIWEDIIIDDLTPCQPRSKDPAFNSSKSEELWVILMEKAWAKVHGGYANIVGGLLREALRDLTGAPAITFFTSEGTPEDHWKNLMDAENQGYIIACGSDDIKQSGDDSLDATLGLAGNHAYSLLSVHEIVNEGGRRRELGPNEPSNPSNERIVRLRNPWGEGEWKGDWSDKSPKWTPELK